MCTRLQIHARFKLLTLVKTKNLMSQKCLIQLQPCGCSLLYFHSSGPSQKAFRRNSWKQAATAAWACSEMRTIQAYSTVILLCDQWTLQRLRSLNKRTCNTGLNRLIRHKLCQRTVSYHIECVLKPLRQNMVFIKYTNLFNRSMAAW